jgi:hypothetical protein
LPVFRAVSTALLRCFPDAHASIRLGLALETRAVKLKSRTWTLPAPAPPPTPPGGAGFVSPQDHASTSISPLCLSSVLSPGMPSIFRK